MGHSKTDKKKWKNKNLGRVSLHFPKGSATSGSRKNSSGQHQLADSVLAPEEVLFSRKNAPQRYAEKDIYFAHQDLPDGGRDVLPDSDLVKAMHGYASNFYDALGQRHDRYGGMMMTTTTSRVDEKSMDETALLAFGILLEEAARDSLGKNGDVVFTEGVEDEDEEEDDDDVGSRGRGGGDREANGNSRGSRHPVGFEGEEEFWKRRYPKRRKIKVEKD